MKPAIVLGVVVAAGMFLLGRATQAGDEAPKTVPAKKYRVFSAPSTLDAIHGGGGWIHGLFLPDAKVAASLNYRWELHLDEKDRASEQIPTLAAYPADKPENDVVGFYGAPTQIEEIEVPADLAKEIADFAALTKRFRAEGERLGREARQRLKLEPIPNERAQ